MRRLAYEKERTIVNARTAHVAARPTRHQQAERHFLWATDAQMMGLMMAVFCMFCFRDAATASFRYYLSIANLSFVWFIPDVLSVVAMGFFFTRIVAVNRSAFGWLLLGNLVLSIATCILFMSPDGFALFSAIKLFTPIFVGFVFAGRDITETRWVRYCVLTTVIVSVIGLILAPHINYPWIGAKVDSLGMTRTVGRLWWTSGGIVRYGGFAGDSTMAAYMCVFPYILVHRHLSKLVNLALWIPLWWAIWISTSKTALLTFSVFCLYYLVFVVLIPRANRAVVLRLMAQFSFAGLVVPLLLIALFSGVDLTKVDPILFSMQDRITNSWQIPFGYLWDMSPLWVITGCGFGCFSYPMQYTIMAPLEVPVDNFYISTYLMMGLPFVITVIGMFTAAMRSMDPTKLLLIVVLNIYMITVQCYGPSTATIMVGYAFGDMFLGHRQGWKRRRRQAKATDGDKIRPRGVPVAA